MTSDLTLKFTASGLLPGLQEWLVTSNGGVSTGLEVPCEYQQPTSLREWKHRPRNHRPTLRGLQLGSTLGPPSILQLHHSSRSDASDLSSCLSQPPHPVTVGIT